jgi:hypothetical protein
MGLQEEEGGGCEFMCTAPAAGTGAGDGGDGIGGRAAGTGRGFGGEMKPMCGIRSVTRAPSLPCLT